MSLFNLVLGISFLLSSFTASADLNQCIVDICGPASENRNIDFYQNQYESDDKLNKNEKEFLLKAIDANKENFFSIKVNALKEIEAFSLETFNSINSVDKGILVLFVQGLIPLSTISYSSNNRIRGEFSELFIDDSLEYDEVFKILQDAGNDESLSSLQANYIINIKQSKLARKVLGMMFSRAPEHALGDHFNSENKETILKLYHEKMSQVIDEILNHDTASDSKILKFLANSYKGYLEIGDLSAEEISQLNLLFGLNLFKMEFLKEQKGSAKEGFWDNTLDDRILESTFEMLQTKAKSMTSNSSYSKKDREEDFLEAKKICIEKLEYNIQKLPTRTQINNFIYYYRKLVKGAKSFTEKNISYSFAKVVDKKLSKLQIDLPPTREVFIKKVPVIMKNKASANVDLSVVLANLIIAPIGENTYSFLIDSCSQGSIEGAFYDYSVSSLWHAPSLKLSWTTLKEFERFKGVIAHEVGHQLYMLYEGEYDLEERFTWAEFNNSRNLFQCISQNHEDRSISRSSWSPDGALESFKVSKYANEDFADQFAAYIEKETAANYACVFLKIEDNQYSDLSFINTDDDDHHSSNAFRVLSIEKTKQGALPESCNRALDDQNYEVHVCAE
jgi:hypothetical protein